MKRDLDRLREHTFDVLVVGGGIHGAWAAWDATLRGRSVALLEKGDFGAATSANSLKIVHGGLRYLQSADFRRMRESIQERATLLKVAPHLVEPLPFVVPTHGRGTRSRTALRAALRLSDAVGFDRSRHDGPELPGGRIIPKAELERLFPFLKAEAASGGALWYDAQVRDSERLTFSILRSAADRGATIANYVCADRLRIDDDAVGGVRARDVTSGECFEVHARVVVDATGPWSGRLLQSAIPATFDPDPNAVTLGMNLVIRRPNLSAALGLQSRVSSNRDPIGGGNRMLFLVPWRNSTMVGTWYPRRSRRPPIQAQERQVRPRASDLQELVNQCNRACPELKLTLSDVTFYHQGWLPLKRSLGPGSTRSLAKRGRVVSHEEEDGIRGLVSIEGVKYTTARLLAERAVDAAWRTAGWEVVPCATAMTSISPAGEADVSSDDSAADGSTSEPLAEGSDVRRQDIIRAVREEMALTLEDVILRRTGMGSERPPRAEELSAAAKICAAELGWNKERREREVRAVLDLYAPLPIQR